ncbi:hypothetical protein JIN84_07875 [Luteolibacter yonseiensis]|uniref:Uncharacterized protein n=1 Tax=Luteolibacter yonseiensis TaxID=1144680 RepID=A0A934V9U7_9BACT|nr:hypothetical protein [Luteolibacter yonseiensis]MBK1815528.1 hypothetical protein [Luteolibacter yonseiensis]
MVDHFFAARISGYATWLFMVLCLGGAALYRLRVGGVPRGISRRAVDLLDRKDWAWILGAGVFLPFVYVMVVIFATPLGGHHSGLKGTGLLSPFGQFLGLWLLWITVPGRIAAWRLRSWAAVLGFPKSGWLGWMVAGAAVVFVPMAGYAAISHSFPGFWRDWLAEHYLEIVEPCVFPVSFWIASGLAGAVLLAILGRMSFAVFTRPDRMIPRAAVSRVLTSVFASALLLTALAIPVFQACGQYWFVRDTLVKCDPALPRWTGYEAKIANQARKELREALGL